MKSPVEQFTIKPIIPLEAFGYDISFTNASLFMLLSIICSFVFLNYGDSRNFLNKVADLAEEEDHHPEIILEWGKVTVTWWSHKIRGLHKNDFICASKTDALFENLHKS